jgi:hypothetical protein
MLIVAVYAAMTLVLGGLLAVIVAVAVPERRRGAAAIAVASFALGTTIALWVFL